MTKRHARLTNDSGLDLIPRRRVPKKEQATVHDYAEAKWKPWRRSPGMHPNDLLPSKVTIQAVIAGGRLAFATNLKTKRELVAMLDSLQPAAGDALMTNIINAAEAAKTIANMCETAYARLLAAGSVIDLRDQAAVPSVTKPRVR